MKQIVVGFLLLLLGLLMFIGSLVISIWGPDLSNGQEIGVFVLGAGGFLVFIAGLEQLGADL